MMKDFIQALILTMAASLVAGVVWATVTAMLIFNPIYGILFAIGVIILGLITFWVWYD